MYSFYCANIAVTILGPQSIPLFSILDSLPFSILARLEPGRATLTIVAAVHDTCDRHTKA